MYCFAARNLQLASSPIAIRDLSACVPRTRWARGLMIMNIQQVRENERMVQVGAWGSGSGCPTSGMVAADCPPRPIGRVREPAIVLSPRDSPLRYIGGRPIYRACSRTCCAPRTCNRSRATIRRSIAPLAETKRRVKARTRGRAGAY